MASRRSAGFSSWGFQSSALRRVTVVVPMPVGFSPRIAYYASPRPRQRMRRVIRQPLGRPGRYQMRRVTVLMPRALPRVRGSYVSIDRYNRLNIHSRRQTVNLLDREYNRERYSEDKRSRRTGRNGQLESVRGDRLGIIGAAVHARLGVSSIGDAAMVSRALGAS